MPQMPKRVKFRKTQRGRVRGVATRGNTVSFGEFGLQSLEGGWLSAEALEAGRVTVAQFLRGEGRLYIRVFPHKSITAIPAGQMGKGRASQVLGGGDQARNDFVRGRRSAEGGASLSAVAYKMPFKCPS